MSLRFLVAAVCFGLAACQTNAPVLLQATNAPIKKKAPLGSGTAKGFHSFTYSTLPEFYGKHKGQKVYSGGSLFSLHINKPKNTAIIEFIDTIEARNMAGRTTKRPKESMTCMISNWAAENKKTGGVIEAGHAVRTGSHPNLRVSGIAGALISVEGTFTRVVQTKVPLANGLIVFHPNLEKTLRKYHHYQTGVLSNCKIYKYAGKRVAGPGS